MVTISITAAAFAAIEATLPDDRGAHFHRAQTRKRGAFLRVTEQSTQPLTRLPGKTLVRMSKMT
jgi:hypothetical protein